MSEWNKSTRANLETLLKIYRTRAVLIGRKIARVYFGILPALASVRGKKIISFDQTGMLTSH